MNIKCINCKDDIYDPIDEEWKAWTCLMHFLEIQNLQGDISNELFEYLADNLAWFKPVEKKTKEEEEE